MTPPFVSAFTIRPEYGENMEKALFPLIKKKAKSKDVGRITKQLTLSESY